MIRFLTISLLLTSTLSFGQYDVDSTEADQPADTTESTWYKMKKNIYVGGELSLSFGNELYLYLGPLAGYDIWKGLSAGVQTMYQLRRTTFSTGTNYSSHAFGGGIFARWRPEVFPYVLVQSEFTLYNVEDLTTLQNGDRTTIPAFMSGVGYAGGFGRAYYHILLMYDFIDDPSMPLPRFFGNFPLYIRYGMVFYLG